MHSNKLFLKYTSQLALLVLCLGAALPSSAALVATDWKQSFTVDGAIGDMFDGLQVGFLNNSTLAGASSFLLTASFQGINGHSLASHDPFSWGNNVTVNVGGATASVCCCITCL